MTKFTIRRYNVNLANSLANQGVPFPLAKALVARGVERISDLDYNLKNLLSPAQLKNCVPAGEMIARAILDNKKIVIAGDYDCDGATAVSVGLLGLSMLGARKVDYIIPNREKDGYGLSVPLVERILEHQADLIITVDNGISSVDAVKFAKEKGINVIVTDHHLPGDTLPEADFIVNPNQPGDDFPSKCIAGVGVMFYVLMATRSALRAMGQYAERPQPNLSVLLDLVALGTIADVVPLDKNNRILISKGLERIHEGRMQPGLTALLSVAGRNSYNLTAQDLAFSIAPRINAAGRLATICSGVNCLTSPDLDTANRMANELEQFNRERRQKESQMQTEALNQLRTISVEKSNAICLFDPSWHSGIVGLVASRVKEQLYRPTIAFAPSTEDGKDGELKGSGRSIAGVHMRDTLDLISKRHPGLIRKFGGHAMAAGLTIEQARFDEFKKAFESAVVELSSEDVFQESVATDGDLTAPDFTVGLAEAIQHGIWGSTFPEPLFANRFNVISQQVLKDAHLKLQLETDGRKINAIWFRHTKQLPPKVYLSYRLSVNEWQNRKTVQLIIEGMETDDLQSWA